MSLFSSAAVRALAPHLMDLVKGVLPLFTPEKEAAEAPPEVQALLEQRQVARKAKNFKEADAVRDALKEKGWVIEDTSKGARLKKIQGS